MRCCDPSQEERQRQGKEQQWPCQLQLREYTGRLPRFFCCRQIWLLTPSPPPHPPNVSYIARMAIILPSLPWFSSLCVHTLQKASYAYSRKFGESNTKHQKKVDLFLLQYVPSMEQQQKQGLNLKQDYSRQKFRNRRIISRNLQIAHCAFQCCSFDDTRGQLAA